MSAIETIQRMRKRQVELEKRSDILKELILSSNMSFLKIEKLKIDSEIYHLKKGIDQQARRL